MILAATSIDLSLQLLRLQKLLKVLLTVPFFIGWCGYLNRNVWFLWISRYVLGNMNKHLTTIMADR